MFLELKDTSFQSITIKILHFVTPLLYTLKKYKALKLAMLENIKLFRFLIYYLLLRFGLVNSIDTYLELKIRLVLGDFCLCLTKS